MLIVIAVLATGVAGSHEDARKDLEERFEDRAASTGALLDALLDASAARSAEDFTRRHGGRRVRSAELEESVRRSRSVYALVAGADGRVLAATRGAPAAAAARAGAAVRRLGFPGAPQYLLSSASDQSGRAIVEMAVPFRAGKALRVHLLAVRARAWTGFFDETLKRAAHADGSRALVLDDRGRVLGDSEGAQHPGAPYGRSAIASAGGTSPFAVSSQLGRSPLQVVHVTSRAKLYAPVGGRRAWASWLALLLAAAAMGAGLWLTSRLRTSHAALRRSEERYALAIRAANDGVWDWDLESGRMHYSERWAEMLGEPAPLGDSPGAWLDRVHEEDRAALEDAIDAHVAGATEFLDHEHRLRAADGSWMWALVRGLAVFGADGRPTRMAGSLSDITSRRDALAHLEHQANHDPLTGLPNRAFFFGVLERALERSRHPGQPPCGVVFLDLDGFKLVNDRYGHVFGDAVLATVGERLQRSVRPGDVVGRLGGDELGVLLTSVADEEEAEAVAARISDALAEPYDVLGETVCIGASAGIAVATPGDGAEELLRQADAAMYRSKLAV